MPKRYVLCTPLSKTHGDWVQCVDPSCMDGGEEELRSMIIHVGFERIRAAEDREPTPQNVADRSACPVPLTVRGTQALVSFAPLAFKLFCAARQNAVLRRSPFPSP